MRTKAIGTSNHLECPYCKEDLGIDDVIRMQNGEQQIVACPECDKAFKVVAEVSSTYYTYKIKGE